ncbi:MAG: GxxExxY protein [Phycisphaerales bacterium]
MHDQQRPYDNRGYNDNRNYNRRDPRGNDRGGERYGERPPRRGTPLSELDPALTEVSRKVIGCAIDVHMELGPGYDESVYAKALQLEMGTQGVAFKPAHPFDVYFDDKVVGTTTADLWVADRFIVEIMARPGEIGGYERAQLRAQLRAADVELGLIINFGERRLKDGLVRVLNPDKLNELKGEGAEGGEGEHEEEGEFQEEHQPEPQA